MNFSLPFLSPPIDWIASVTCMGACARVHLQPFRLLYARACIGPTFRIEYTLTFWPTRMKSIDNEFASVWLQSVYVVVYGRNATTIESDVSSCWLNLSSFNIIRTNTFAKCLYWKSFAWALRTREGEMLGAVLTLGRNTRQYMWDPFRAPTCVSTVAVRRCNPPKQFNSKHICQWSIVVAAQ